MCGRFVQSSSEYYAELFGVSTELLVKPRYNIAPSTDVLVCRLNGAGEKELLPLRWGLIPSWSKGPDHRYRMINARAETVAQKPAYRVPFRQQRCLIPAAGFYEWQQNDNKQPYYIHHADDSPVVFAGLWDSWQNPQGERIDSCVIIVCCASHVISSIHERMPVILPQDAWDNWLIGRDIEAAMAYIDEDLEIYPVARTVNSPKNDNIELIRRICSS